MMMKRLVYFVCALLLMVMSAFAKNDKMPQYDIVGAGSGSEGTVLVKVFVYAKKVTDNDLKRAAVHGVIFRGCSGNNSGASQPAMASPSVETDKASFFNAFFAEDGQCLNYASIVSGSYERIKTTKGYKVGAIIQVNKTTLRKDLEKAGTIRSLSSGF